MFKNAFRTMLAGFLALSAQGAGAAVNDDATVGFGDVTFGNVNLIPVGDSLTVTFDVYVSRDLKRHESLVIAPTLKDESGSLYKLHKMAINSRNQHIAYKRGFHKDYTTSILRTNGSMQQVAYTQTVPYSDWMADAVIEVMSEDCKCTVSLGEPVGLGMLATTPPRPERFEGVPLPLPAEAAPNEEIKRRDLRGSALITYELDRWELKPFYMDNMRQLTHIIEAIEAVERDTTLTFSEMDLHGYASLEGEYKHNDFLAKNRLETLRDWIAKKYPFTDGHIDLKHTAENWDDVRDSLLVNRDLRDWAEVMALVENTTMEPDLKEQKLRTDYPEMFKYMLEHWFPINRLTKFCIHYTARPYREDELEMVFRTKPENLSLKELYTLADRYPYASEAYGEVIRKTLLLYPDNSTANYNYARYMLYNRNIELADSCLEKIEEGPKRDLLEGVLYIILGDQTEGTRLIKEAKKAGLDDADYYLNLLEGK